MNALRIAFGMLCASLAPTILVSLLLDPVVGLIALAVALGHAAALGLPLATLGVAKGMISLASAIVRGLVAGALLAGTVTLPVPCNRGTMVLFSPDSYFYVGASPASAWMFWAELIVVAGLFGAAGNVAFWLSWRWTRGKTCPDG